MDEQRMSDDELRTMFSLLRRFASIELDQFESWVFATKYGDVYVNVRRRPVEGASPEAYDRIRDEFFQDGP